MTTLTDDQIKDIANSNGHPADGVYVGFLEQDVVSFARALLRAAAPVAAQPEQSELTVGEILEMAHANGLIHGLRIGVSVKKTHIIDFVRALLVRTNSPKPSAQMLTVAQMESLIAEQAARIFQLENAAAPVAATPPVSLTDYKLVPLKPTREMENAFFRKMDHGWPKVWEEVLDAAPAAQQVSQVQKEQAND